MQVSQYLTLTVMPLTITSFVLGNCRLGVRLPPTSIDCAVNSSSGGCELRGTMPGSRTEVRKRSPNTYRQKEIYMYGKYKTKEIIQMTLDNKKYSLTRAKVCETGNLEL